MTFEEVYAGLEDIWYRFAADLWGTAAGFEFLGRYFLKLARTPKVSGYHHHMTLEHSDGPSLSEPELTIGIVAERPPAA